MRLIVEAFAKEVYVLASCAGGCCENDAIYQVVTEHTWWENERETSADFYCGTCLYEEGITVGPTKRDCCEVTSIVKLPAPSA